MKITFEIPESAVSAALIFTDYKKGKERIETVCIDENELEDGITVTIKASELKE